MHWQVYALFMLLQLAVPWQIVAIPSTTSANAQHLYQPREPLTKQSGPISKFNVSLHAKQPAALSYVSNLPTEHIDKADKAEQDGDASKKIIGSSVVTSVSVVLNGDEPQFTDALGHKVPKPQPSLQVASPIDLLNPDRYEFYTFDDNGDLVRRLMTLQEIQSIVANGDGEGPNIIHPAPIDDRDPEKNVQDIVYSVQNVLNNQVENKNNASNVNKMPALDTPDVSSSWAMILPAIFGNTGGDIYPQQKPQQIVMMPDTDLVETPAKEATVEQTTKRNKPNKRKPGQKRKSTTTSTTEMTPQIVQEELASDESVYTGIKQYQHIAANVQDFQAFSNIHMQPIYHKLPETTTKRIYLNNEKVIQSTTGKKPNLSSSGGDSESTQQSVKKPTVAQNKPSTPHRKSATKRPRPTQNHTKGQKKPASSHNASQSPAHTKNKPTKASKPVTTTVTPTTAKTTTEPIVETTSTTTPAVTTTEASVNTTPSSPSSTSAPPSTSSVQKKKKKKPSRHPNPGDTSSSSRPHQSSTQKRKPSTSHRPKPTKVTPSATDNTKPKPANDQISEGTITPVNVHKTHHRHRPKPNKPAATTPVPSTVQPVPVSSTEGSLVVELYPGLPKLPANTRTTTITPLPKTSEEPMYLSPGYPIPTYSIEQTENRPAEEVVINQLKTQGFPSLSLLQQQYQQPQIDDSTDTESEDDLKLSFGQIVQALKQTTTNSGVIVGTEQSLKPFGYDSAESIDKLEEMVNKRKQPYTPQHTTTETEISSIPITQHELETTKPFIEQETMLENKIVTNPTHLKPINLTKEEAVDAEILLSTTEAYQLEEKISSTEAFHKMTSSVNEANVIKFEPLLVDDSEPIVKDLPTTTIIPPTADDSEQEMTTDTNIDVYVQTITTENADLLATTESTLFTDTATSTLEYDTEETTTLSPPDIADLSSQLSLDIIGPNDSISMSNFQTHAATVASHLIDGLKSASISNRTDTKDEIEKLISDVMQQVSESNANEAHNRLTSFANLNTSFLLHPTTHADSTTGQLINHFVNNFATDMSLELDMPTTTESLKWLEENTETTALLPIEDMLEKHEFPTVVKDVIAYKDDSPSIITLAETTTTNPIFKLDLEKELLSTLEKFVSNNDENLTTDTTLSSLESQFAKNEEGYAATNIIPVKLNKSEQDAAETLSAIENFKKYNGVNTLKANDEENNTETNTNNKYDNKQMLDATAAPVNNERMKESVGNETKSPTVDSELGTSEIKVNDAGTQKEVDKQQLETEEEKLEDNITGAAQLEPQYEFATETSIEHKIKAVSKLDAGNPINSASQNTKDVEILSAINNNAEETMPENESGTEISLGFTTSTPDVSTTYSNEENDEYLAQSTYTIESTSLPTNEVKHTADISSSNTVSAINEDPYIKLGEQTMNEFTTEIAMDAETTTLRQPLTEADGPIITSVANEKDGEKLAEDSYDILDKPDEEDEVDQYTPTLADLNTMPATVSKVTTTDHPKISVTTPAAVFTTKRLHTLKPVSYYKQPALAAYMQPEFPKPVTYITAQQRPMQRPAALTNLMATSTMATRPPVKLEPSPSHSKGLEGSTLGLEEDVLEFARLCNELAFNYWKSITSEKVSSARSLIISPFALTSMLSMVFLGARGSTSGEMNEVLKLDDMVTFNPHLIFKNITDSVEKAVDSDIATTAFVREIFSDRANGRVLPFFKEKTQQFYAGHVEEVNFHVVNDLIRRRTNLLVKRHTMGRVQEYLRTNSVWVNGPLATISANLFQTDCSRGSTVDRDGELFFQVHPTVRQRRIVPIPAVLYKTGFTAGYDTKLEATIVAFGRIQDTVSTIYVMPGLQSSTSPADNLERLEKQLVELAFTENAWSNLLTTLMDRPGLEVQLPRFSHRSFVNASLGLQKMGLKGLFKSDFADLRGLTGSSNHDVFLSDMIQINTFSTCGEERIADHHHVEMYPAPPLRKRNKDVDANDDDTLDSSEAIIDFGSLVHESALARSFYDDLLDPKFLELPLPLRPRQARVPDAPPRLRFDKPFLYFVRHNPTGIILFMGRFNPRLLP